MFSSGRDGARGSEDTLLRGQGQVRARLERMRRVASSCGRPSDGYAQAPQEMRHPRAERPACSPIGVALRDTRVPAQSPQCTHHDWANGCPTPSLNKDRSRQCEVSERTSIHELTSEHWGIRPPMTEQTSPPGAAAEIGPHERTRMHMGPGRRMVAVVADAE
jgi:hypothetical protein